MTDDNTDMSGRTCRFLDDEDCPRCGYYMATNGRYDWCCNDEVCGYSRKSISAPLGSEDGVRE